MAASEAAARRIAVLSSQLCAQPASCSMYASATGAATSYEKARANAPRVVDARSHRLQVHGSVSRAPAAWRPAAVAEGELREVLYEKAEGMAKARRRRPEVSAARRSRAPPGDYKQAGAAQRVHAENRHALPLAEPACPAALTPPRSDGDELVLPRRA